MGHNGSLCVLIGPYASLCFLIGPDRSFFVFMVSNGSLWAYKSVCVFMGLNESR